MNSNHSAPSISTQVDIKVTSVKITGLNDFPLPQGLAVFIRPSMPYEASKGPYSSKGRRLIESFESWNVAPYFINHIYSLAEPIGGIQCD